MLYDAHNHLQDAWLRPQRDAVFEDLSRIPLASAIVNGTAETDWADVATLAGEHAFIQPAYGLHPWYVGNATERWRAGFLHQLDRNPRATVGEIGLDRWILERARPDDPRLAGLIRAPLAAQVAAFTWQLEQAAARNRPATIHCVDAWGALVEVLRSSPRPHCGFLLHAYGGSGELAREFTAMGAYYSFNGSYLAHRQQPRRDVFATLPADRLLVETDAPAMPLPPEAQTHRLAGLADGNPINHPANIGAVYAGLAKIRGVSEAELEARVAENFHRLFG